MKIQIHGRKEVATKSVNDYLTDKLKKLDKYFDSKDIKAKVNISVKNSEQSIEVSIPTKLFTIRAEERSLDLYKSIDLVIDKLERQITKNKDKLKKKYRNVESFDLNIDFDSEEEELDIVKRKNLNSKPMDEEEALLQMQLVSHDFFVFKNEDEECVSVVYKRKDGKFGIINIK